MKKTTGKVGEAVKTKQPPRTSPSAKMSLNHLRLPAQMKIPSRVDLRKSTVDESILGVWSKRPFKKGEVFGPFMGKKVMDATEDMDPSYVWEVSCPD
ncbi:hypothetical protein NP493_286g00009 [Ridgeia piscesae]|uniref:Uncharacterized protein n=1 Tax=Ridgeia piscesae TaxID=27915 RepID=A0AAD9NWY1_RIDPI|nr:hypothetical protein NP493_286g00009 [Ridgeia piscesae]